MQGSDKSNYNQRFANVTCSIPKSSVGGVGITRIQAMRHHIYINILINSSVIERGKLAKRGYNGFC